MASILKTLAIGGAEYEFDATQFGGKTVSEWEAVIAGGVDYLGVLSSLEGLSTTAGYGDFYRVIEGFDNVHAGDLVICNVNTGNPKQVIGSDWIIVHGEEGNLISHTHTFTPAGTVTSTLKNATAASHNHDFVGTKATLTQTITPVGNITINGGAKYQPTGTISAKFTGTKFSVTPTFTGTTATLQPTFGTIDTTTTGASNVTTVATAAHVHTLEISTSGNTKYTPTGNVALSQSTKTFNSITNKGTASKLESNYDSTNKKLTLTFTEGTVPSIQEETINEVSGATFTGTEGEISMGSSGIVTTAATDSTNTAYVTSVATGDHKHEYIKINSIAPISYTPAGTVSEVAHTPAGTVTATFTGDEKLFTGSFSGEDIAISIDYTPKGTINPSGVLAVTGDVESTFTGTPDTTSNPTTNA